MLSHTHEVWKQPSNSSTCFIASRQPSSSALQKSLAEIHRDRPISEILLPFVVAATSRLRNRRWNPPELVSNRTLLIVPTHDLILHGIVVSSAGFSGFRKGYYGFAIPHPQVPGRLRTRPLPRRASSPIFILILCWSSSAAVRSAPLSAMRSHRFPRLAASIPARLWPTCWLASAMQG